MATFEAQVEALTSLSIDGSSAPTQTELTQFLTDGAKEVVNTLPENLLSLCSSEQSFTSGTPQTLNTGNILYVTRSDGTIAQPCRYIAPNLVGRSLDSGDMNAATTTDPIYYIKNNTIDVAPSSGSSVYSEVQYPAVAFGDSAVAVFPDEAEYLIPLYASVKALQNVLGNKSSNSDITTALTAMKTELNELPTIADSVHTEIGLAKIEAAEIVSQTDNSGNFETACDAMVTELTKVDEVILQASEEFDEVATQTSGTATSAITSARSAVPSVLSIGDLSINAVLPMTPSINTISYTDATNADVAAVAVGSITVSAPSKADVSGNVPSYIKPVHATRVSFEDFFNLSEDGNPFGDSDPGEFSISISVPVVPAINTISYTDAINADAASTAVDTLDNLASAIAIIDVSSNAPTFTKPTTAPDFAKISEHLDTNEDPELASVKIQQIQAQISEYNTNIQNEQAEFNKENVRYQMEFQEAVTKYNADLKVEITNANNQAEEFKQESRQATDIDKFNKAQDQALNLANSAKQMEDLIADNNSNMQKYSNELKSYQAEVNKEVSEYSQKFSRYQFEINTAYQAWAKTESDNVQVFQIDIQNELNEFNKENALYQANIKAEFDKHSTDLQKALTQAQIDAKDAQQEASQSTEVDKINKAQDQALALANSSKNMEKLISDNNNKLQKYSNELQSYSAQINKDVQEYQQNLQQKIQEFDSSRKLQQSYLEEAQAGISSGSAYLQEAQAIIAQANGYAAEVNARASFTGAKTQAVQAYISTAQSYIAEMQSKAAISQGYASEVQARLGVDTAHYGWYEKQQAKLQADYDKGLQILIGVKNG